MVKQTKNINQLCRLCDNVIPEEKKYGKQLVENIVIVVYKENDYTICLVCSIDVKSQIHDFVEESSSKKVKHDKEPKLSLGDKKSKRKEKHRLMKAKKN